CSSDLGVGARALGDGRDDRRARQPHRKGRPVTRITQSMTARLLLTDLQSTAERLSRTQQRIANGKQITVPSDDPFGTSRALQLRSELDEYRQYGTNVREASSWQDVSDTALRQVGDLALRARDLLVQGASDTAGP